MKYFFRCVLALFILCVGVEVQAQKQWQKMHKVKRQETLFGIAKKYNLTINELVKANPDMNTPGYELKKVTIYSFHTLRKRHKVQRLSRERT